MKSRYELDKLGNYIEQIRGISYKPSDISDEKKEGYKVVLRANSIKDNKLLLDDLVYVKDELIKEKQIIKCNDILMAASSGSKEIVGKSVQIKEDTEYTFGAFCKLIRSSENINPNYVAYFFRTPYYRATISSIVCGANINNLKNEHIDELLIPITNKENQEKIVNVLDKAQELIDKRKEQIEALDELVKSKFIEMFGNPVTNDSDWNKIMCKDISSKIGSGATPKGGNSSYKDEGISLIRSMNIHNNKFIDKDLAFIDNEQAEKLKNVIVEENDVLLNITGASVARCCIVPNKYIPARVNQHVAIIRCNKDVILPKFLEYQLTNDNYQRFLWDIATSGGATREAITKQQIENLEVIIPPIEIQNQFVKFVKQVDKLKLQMEKSLKELEDNFNSLMQKAFKGELF